MKLENIKPGDILSADGGFICLRQHEHVEVKQDRVGLYIDCEHGRHRIDEYALHYFEKVV